MLSSITVSPSSDTVSTAFSAIIRPRGARSRVRCSRMVYTPTRPSGSSTLYFLPKTFPTMTLPASATTDAPLSMRYLFSSGLTILKSPRRTTILVPNSCVQDGLDMLPCIMTGPSYAMLPAM